MKRLAVALVLPWFLAACSGGTGSEEPMTDPNVVRISVFRDGTLAVNGEEASLEELRSTLADLQGKDGSVWYYREGADEEPHPNARLVIEAVVDAALPISMSTKPDFSDVVMPDGSTVPRR